MCFLNCFFIPDFALVKVENLRSALSRYVKKFPVCFEVLLKQDFPIWLCLKKIFFLYKADSSDRFALFF